MHQLAELAAHKSHAYESMRGDTNTAQRAPLKTNHLTGLASFLLLLPAPPGVLFKGALGVYALSHALNHARHQGLSFVQAREALAQGLHQAVRAG